MRFSASVFGALTLATLALAGCTGSQGNPDGQPYANDPGGAVAVKPETIGQVAYNPYATPAPFTDMQVGQAAINPPAPMVLPPAPANPPRSRQR